MVKITDSYKLITTTERGRAPSEIPSYTQNAYKAGWHLKNTTLNRVVCSFQNMRLFIFTQQPHHKLKAMQNLRFSHILVLSYVSDMLIVMLSSPLISPQQQSPRNEIF